MFLLKSLDTIDVNFDLRDGRLLKNADGTLSLEYKHESSAARRPPRPAPPRQWWTPASQPASQRTECTLATFKRAQCRDRIVESRVWWCGSTNAQCRALWNQ